MKVLQISKFFPPIRGGIESAAFELAEGLNRHGVPSDVLCANTAVGSRQDEMISGYKVVRSGSFGTLLSTSMSPMLMVHARRMMTAYDVVHVHMPNPMAALALRLSPPRGKLIVHWHSDVIRQRFAQPLYAPLQDWLLQRADAIVATTPPYVESSDVLRRWHKKVEIIPLGVSDHSARVDPQAVQAIRDRYAGKRLVFALGRMTYYKGFDVLIRAARMLPEDCVVLIGGSGRLMSVLGEQVQALNLHGRVHLLGPLEDGPLLAHFAACDVFCLPSTARAEAFGIAMIEAMAMEKPVVSADIPGSGVSWINRAGVSGLTVPVGNAQALADGLRRILADPGLQRRFGLAARNCYLQRFTADHMVGRVINLYQRVAGAH